MSTRGPVPKRSSQRRRTNSPDTDKGVALPADIPEADAGWHPVARRWFDSLSVSGQSFWYQASDWATAYLLAESISRELKPQPVGNTEAGDVVWASLPPKGASLAAWLKAMSSLLVTEGDRRRMRIELAKSDSSEEHADVSWIDDARLRRSAD